MRNTATNPIYRQKTQMYCTWFSKPKSTLQ